MPSQKETINEKESIRTQLPLPINYWSKKFILTMLIGILRNGSIFYLCTQVKYLGILYINDDKFVTWCLVCSIATSLIFRVFYGSFVKYLKFFGTMYLCHVLCLVTDISVIFLSMTRAKSNYLVFLLLERCCLGLLYCINYTIPYHLFGNQNGLKAMKVLDFQLVISFFLTSVLFYVFQFFGVQELLFYVFVFTDSLAIFLCYLLKRESE